MALYKPTATTSVVPLILRLALAGIFIYHGWMKIGDPHNDWGAAWATNAWLAHGRVPPGVHEKLWAGYTHKDPADGNIVTDEEQAQAAEAKLQKGYAATNPQAPDLLAAQAGQLAVAWGELLGGLALLVGLLARIAAIGLIIIQIGAIITVTGARGFFGGIGGETGFEYNLALIAMCLTLLLLGPGVYSLDRLIWHTNQPAEPKPAAVTV